jgi:hypothetical protein
VNPELNERSEGCGLQTGSSYEPPVPQVSPTETPRSKLSLPTGRLEEDGWIYRDGLTSPT